MAVPTVLVRGHVQPSAETQDTCRKAGSKSKRTSNMTHLLTHSRPRVSMFATGSPNVETLIAARQFWKLSGPRWLLCLQWPRDSVTSHQFNMQGHGHISCSCVQFMAESSPNKTDPDVFSVTAEAKASQTTGSGL